MHVDDTWYSGEHHRLDALHHQHGQHRRKLWGKRRPEHKREHRLHVPLPGDIAATSAALIMADMPTIRVDDATTQARLDVLLDEGHVQQVLLGALEQCAALGGIVLRAGWDTDLADRPLLDVAQPDGAMPEWRHGILRGMTLWRELPGSDRATVWRHLEWHESGVIVEALFKGRPDNLGKQMPLEAHPETADLAAGVDGDGRKPTGIKSLTVSYIPNMLPNRMHRGSPVGRSDYAAPIYDMFGSLDETWTSWMRDLRLARSRLLVPESYLSSAGPGAGAVFEDDREVYASLHIPPVDGGGAQITMNQFEIRVAEHQQTAEALVRQAAQSAGYSAQSFGLDGGGQPITATESDSRDQRSEVTRRAKIGNTRHPLADILGALLELDKAQLKTPGVAPQRPQIEWPDGAGDSLQSIATSLELLNRAGAASKATLVKALHPEWDDTQVKAEVAAILAETGAVPDPVIGA
jgi:hypothetical protein